VPGAATPPARTGPPPARTLPRTRPATARADHQLQPRTRLPRQFQDLAHREVDHAVAVFVITTHRATSHSAAAVLGNRWLEIFWHCLAKGVLYDENIHQANRALGCAA
jgi:hypothetical protein